MTPEDWVRAKYCVVPFETKEQWLDFLGRYKPSLRPYPFHFKVDERMDIVWYCNELNDQLQNKIDALEAQVKELREQLEQQSARDISGNPKSK